VHHALLWNDKCWNLEFQCWKRAMGVYDMLVYCSCHWFPMLPRKKIPKKQPVDRSTVKTANIRNRGENQHS
jgi:hypothetical protein